MTPLPPPAWPPLPDTPAFDASLLASAPHTGAVDRASRLRAELQCEHDAPKTSERTLGTSASACQRLGSLIGALGHCIPATDVIQRQRELERHIAALHALHPSPPTAPSPPTVPVPAAPADKFLTSAEVDNLKSGLEPATITEFLTDIGAALELIDTTAEDAPRSMF